MPGNPESDLLPLMHLFLNSRARVRRQDGWERREAAARRRRRHRLRTFLLHRRQQMIMLLLLRREQFNSYGKRVTDSTHFYFLKEVKSRDWLKRFRMSKDTFAYLCDKLRSHLYRPGPKPEEKVAIALWRLSCHSRCPVISKKCGIGPKTMSRCLKEVCQAVITVMKSLYLLPPKSHTLSDAARTFKSRWGFPHCVGALASFDIPLNSRSEDTSALVLHAVVDGQGLIWEASTCYPESMGRAVILENSFLCELAKEGRLQADPKNTFLVDACNYFLIGDSSYPLQDWLLTPYFDVDKLGPKETMYNLYLERARSVAEIALLRLRARWPILLAPPSYVQVPTLALACCVLHNMCEILEQKFDAHWLEGVESVDLPVLPSSLCSSPADPQAERIREKVCEYFKSQEKM